MNLLLATIVSYQIAAGLPLKHDGYVVEWGMGNGEWGMGNGCLS